MNLAKLQPSPLEDSEWQTEIARQTEHLLSACEPIAIYLFGSALHPIHRSAASDIDLCLVVKTDSERKKLAGLVASMKLGARIPLDLVVFTADEFTKSVDQGAIAEIIVRTGKQLYGDGEGK